MGKRGWAIAGLGGLVVLAGLVIHDQIYERTYIRPEGLKALEAVKGFQPAKAFPPPPGWLMDGFRTTPGNAAEDYDRAMSTYDSRVRAWSGPRLWRADTIAPGERKDLKDHVSAPELVWIESGAVKQDCLFTSRLYPIPNPAGELKIPRLIAGMNLAAILIEKSRQAEEKSDLKEAERLLRCLVSFGHHLEGEYTLPTYLAGLRIRIMGTEALQGLYTRSGEGEKADQCARQAFLLREATKECKTLSHGVLESLTLTPEGRAWLTGLFDAPSTPNAIKSEVAFVTSYSHLYFLTKRIYGAGSDRKKLMARWGRAPDPVLKELVEKSTPYLHLGLKARFSLVERTAVIK